MEKYNKLTSGMDSKIAARIADTIKNLEHVNIRDLTELLGEVKIKEDDDK